MVVSHSCGGFIIQTYCAFSRSGFLRRGLPMTTPMHLPRGLLRYQSIVINIGMFAMWGKGIIACFFWIVVTTYEFIFDELKVCSFEPYWWLVSWTKWGLKSNWVMDGCLQIYCSIFHCTEKKKYDNSE